jgi:hypothetical protein
MAEFSKLIVGDNGYWMRYKIPYTWRMVFEKGDRLEPDHSYYSTCLGSEWNAFTSNTS